MSPLKAIKEHCKWCQQTDRLQAVRKCQDENCPLLSLREGKSVKGVSPLKTIRAKCRECVETVRDIRECPGQMQNGWCPLHPFRMGTKPNKTT